MKIAKRLILAFLILFLISCNVDELVSEIAKEEITAKEKIGAVINIAKRNFASDAELTSIYGREVNSEGKIDLKNLNSVSAFIYVVQSDSVASANPPEANQFYVPVIGSDPIISPVNFSTMLSFVKNNLARNILETVFGTLATVSISSSAVYDDSPQVLNGMLSRSDVSSFRSTNPGSKIDMFLVPSKSVDSTNVNNSADWIVNFYGDTSSLVLWLHPGNSTGQINLLSN